MPREMDAKSFSRFRSYLKKEPIISVLTKNISFLLDAEKRIQLVEVNDRMESYTDGKKVVISGLACFITPDYDREAWTAMMRVNLAHEIQHDNSSDFELVKGIREFYGDYLNKNFGIHPSIGSNVGQFVLNCLEDGRINDIVVNRFPGYLPMMRFVNYGIREYNRADKLAETPEEEMGAYSSQILCYAKSGMNMPGASIYSGSRVEAEFYKIRDLIDKGVTSKTAKGCYEATVELLKIAAPYIAELSQNQSAMMKFLESLPLESYSQSGDDREEEQGSGDGSGQSVRMNKKDEGQENASGDSADGNENSKSTTSASEMAKNKSPKSIDEVVGDFSGEAEAPALTEEETKEMLKKLGEELTKTRVSENERKVETGNKANLSPSDIKDLNDQYASTKFREVFIQPTQKTLPGELQAKARMLHQKLEKILMQRKTSASGFKKGALSTSSLWKVGINDANVFQRKNPPQKVDCCFYELIDRSGSMSCGVGHDISKLYSAVTTAAIVEEALKGLSSTKITAFSSSGGVKHVVIKDFDQKPIGNRAYDSLTQISACGGNKDGYSIRVAAMDLAKRPEKQKILLILSDGLPSDYRGAQEGINDVRNAVKWAATHGIIVVAMMFGDDDFLKNSYPSYQKMYEKNIIACNPATSLREFEKLLSRVIA